MPLADTFKLIAPFQSVEIIGVVLSKLPRAATGLCVALYKLLR